MTHDPLCPSDAGKALSIGCAYCDWISKARADERKNAVARINDAHRQRRIRSVGRAIAAVRGES